MKLILVLVVALLGAWLWRRNREAKAHAKRVVSQTLLTPTEMVRCRHCSVHVALTDAFKGRRGDYCCPDHRQRAEP